MYVTALKLLVRRQEGHLARKNVRTPWDIVMIVITSGWGRAQSTLLLWKVLAWEDAHDKGDCILRVKGQSGNLGLAGNGC